MGWANFENVFADLIHSFELAANRVESIAYDMEDDIYMRIANNRKAANRFRPSYPKCKIPKSTMTNKVMQGRIHKHC